MTQASLFVFVLPPTDGEKLNIWWQIHSHFMLTWNVLISESLGKGASRLLEICFQRKHWAHNYWEFPSQSLTLDFWQADEHWGFNLFEHKYSDSHVGAQPSSPTQYGFWHSSFVILLIATVGTQLSSAPWIFPVFRTKSNLCYLVRKTGFIGISGSISHWSWQKTQLKNGLVRAPWCPAASESPSQVCRPWEAGTCISQCLPVCGQPNLEALSYIFLSVTCYTVLGPNACVNRRLGFMAS